MKRFLVYLLIFAILSAILCFYLDYFMLAYGIIFGIIAIITAISNVTSIDNSIYLDKKMNEYDDNKHLKPRNYGFKSYTPYLLN